MTDETEAKLGDAFDRVRIQKEEKKAEVKAKLAQDKHCGVGLVGRMGG